jgi:Oxidoreductase molybdopterin binding domain
MKSIFIALFFSLLLNIDTAFAQTSPSAPVLLEINGQVNTPLRLTKEQLTALKRVDFTESRSVEQDGKSAVQSVRYQGVLLRQLLDKAGLKPDRRAIRKALILLTAQDGYQASFSWGELFNSQLGDGVVVILRQNADELLETDGFASLRSLQDTRSGPRHVRWLNKIEVLLPGEK